MKKFTLIIVATLVAVSGMAIGTQKHAIAKKFVTTKDMSAPAYAKKIDVSGGVAFQQSLKNVNVTPAKSIRKAAVADEVDTEPISMTLAYQYVYHLYLGYMWDYYPVTEALYVIEGNSIAVQINSLIYMDGTIGEGVNELADYGYEVVTFKAGEVVGTNKETGEEFKLYNCDWDSENNAPVANADNIIGYIYRNEAGEVENIFIPSILAVIGDTSGIIDAGANYDIYPDATDSFYSTVVKGTETNTETQGGDPIELNARAYYWMLNPDETVDVLVEGINGWDEEAWFKMTIAADGTTANVENQQFVGSYTFTRPEGLKGAFFAAAYQSTGGGSFSYIEDGLTFSINMSDEGETYVVNDGEENCAIGYFNDGEGGEYSGYIYSSVANLNILITNELAGIKGVAENVKTTKNAVSYNLAGQQVGKDYKGLVIRDGKKYIVK